ncbi:GlsB/YeaQ/YmgE family stress response membrane protein [Hafnia alvei]
MGIISWVILGLIVGILAKWFMPGKDGGGFFMTVILGIAGALVGGYISSFFGMGSVTGFNFVSLIISSLGAMLLLFIYRKLKN